MEREAGYLLFFEMFGEANAKDHIPLIIRDIRHYLYLVDH